MQIDLLLQLFGAKTNQHSLKSTFRRQEGANEVKYAVKEIPLNQHEWLLREPHCHKRLKHDFLVKYYDHWVENVSFIFRCRFQHLDDWILYIQMEYCGDMSLRKAMDTDFFGFNHKLAYEMIGNCARGLRFLHSHGIAHRDVNPVSALPVSSCD